MRVVSKFVHSLWLIAAIFCVVAHNSKLRAAEGGVSFYVPGLYGDLFVAIPPPAGTYLLSTSIFYPSKASNSLLPGEIDQKLEADIFAEMIRGFWVPETKFLGANMLFGFRLLRLDVEVDTDVATPLGTLSISDDNTGYGDLGIIPLSLYWQIGNLNVNLYEVINIPTGNVEPGRLANTALGHWVFDTILSLTLFDPKTGIEISAVPGISYNLENTETNYKTGVEFHMDAMLNWHFAPTWTIGLHGTVYHQLTKDKGAHPSLGSFKGRAYSIGPSISWLKDIGEQTYLLSAKWLHEFDAKNRLEGDLVLLTMGIKF